MSWPGTAYLLKSTREKQWRTGRDKAREFIISGSVSQKRVGACDAEKREKVFSSFYVAPLGMTNKDSGRVDVRLYK